MHTHTYAHEYTCSSMTLLKHAEEWLLKLKIYAQTYIHIHIYACVYPYIYTCRYIHICMFIHTHTYTNTRTHIQHVHMHTRKHAWNDSAAATARGADADAGSSARLFRSTQSTTFSTFNARTSLYPFPATPTPLNPPSPLPNIPQNSLPVRTTASMVLQFHTDQHNRLHNPEEVPRSFIMANFVVVERLEGNQRCTRAPVGEHTGCRAWECIMWLFTRNERSTKNNQTPQQPITPSRQRAA